MKINYYDEEHCATRRKRIDYLNDGSYRLYLLCKRKDEENYANYLGSTNWLDFRKTLDARYLSSVFIESGLNEECIIECNKMSHAIYNRRARTRDKISAMIITNEGELSSRTYFLTLTFSDETLNKTSEETRRRYVARVLKAFAVQYVANIDYGGERGREHYHAVIRLDQSASITNLKKAWLEYGFIGVKRIKSESSADLSHYINKLTSHSIKKSTGCLKRAIYSRRKFEL